jgi:hypothetical protein
LIYAEAQAVIDAPAKGGDMTADRLLVAALANLLLMACATSSGVQKLGPDTFTVSSAAAPARGGEARRIALDEANEYCAQEAKEILVMNIHTSTTNAFGAGSADVTFRCLTKGDSELRRPDY